MSKFRCSSHRLSIERQRGTTPRNDIICNYCLNNENVNILEDECHVLLYCPLYADIRSRYVGDNIVIRAHTFKTIMSNDDPTRLTRLATYVYHALELHSDYNNL